MLRLASTNLARLKFAAAELRHRRNQNFLAGIARAKDRRRQIGVAEIDTIKPAIQMRANQACVFERKDWLARRLHIDKDIWP